jgi:hypothetical protein
VKGFFAARRSAKSVSFVSKIIISLFGVASCGGEEGGEAVSAALPVGGNAPAATTGDGAPWIVGDPSTAVAFGATYSFLPKADDPDGAPLSFSIAHRPAWATFSSTTGRLSGTPGPGDVGSYENITISVSDGTHSVNLPQFHVNVVGTATGSITVSWLAPAENSDGSPLTTLAGYKLYWGTAPGDYPNSVTVNHPGIMTYVIESLTPGTYYLVVTAFDADGIESEYSDVTTETVY